MIKKYADADESDILLQKRKWVVCLFKILIDNINKDCTQGLLELMEFWTTVGAGSVCPIVFPKKRQRKFGNGIFYRSIIHNES